MSALSPGWMAVMHRYDSQYAPEDGDDDDN